MTHSGIRINVTRHVGPLFGALRLKKQAPKKPNVHNACEPSSVLLEVPAGLAALRDSLTPLHPVRNKRKCVIVIMLDEMQALKSSS